MSVSLSSPPCVASSACHPVELLQTSIPTGSDRAIALAAPFGSFAENRVRLESAILGQFTRLPGLHSSNAGLEALWGMDEEIGYKDYLGGYNTKFETNKRAEMEKRVFGESVKL